MNANPKHNAAVAEALTVLDKLLRGAKSNLVIVKDLEATDDYAAAEELVEIWATLYDAIDDGQLEWRRSAQVEPKHDNIPEPCSVGPECRACEQLRKHDREMASALEVTR